MTQLNPTVPVPGLSLVCGAPLEEEPGLGSLTIPGYLRAVTERYGDAEAVVLRHGEVELRWSYRDLWSHSMAVARALVASGAGRGSRVGILMTNRPEYLAALFGTALAGGVSVALNTFATGPELEQMLAASDVSVLLFEDKVLNKDFAATLLELEPAIAEAEAGRLRSSRFPYLRQLVRLPGLVTAGVESPVAQLPSLQSWDGFLASGEGVSESIVEARAAGVAACDPGGLFFSSGTTSLPKGILHAQRAFAVQWWRWPRVFCIREPARSWTGNGFFWSGNISMIVGTALTTGGAIILQPLFQPEQALQLVEQEKVTMMNGRPHQWARLREAEGWKNAELGSLRYVTKGELILDHPTIDSDWELPNSFGTTETMTILSSFDAEATAEQYAGSFGAALPGNVLKIINPMTGETLPMGERGELCVKGPTLMLGYIGKSLEECFDGDGFYRTGDGAYLDDSGRLFWEGRLNDIIKTGGANISPEEIDTAIAGFPGVKRTQTVGVPHDTLGEMAVACIVTLPGAQLDHAALTDYLRERLASYKIPREILEFNEDEFALTGNEKPRAGEIRQRACQRLGIVAQ